MTDIMEGIYTISCMAQNIDCDCVCVGSVIRCIRRLAELLRQMCQAAKAIGNTELENKFSQGVCLFVCLFVCLCIYLLLVLQGF